MDDIEIGGGKPSTISINLVGVTYQGRPPKTVALVNMTEQVTKKNAKPADILKFLRQFLGFTFGKDDAAAIMGRLEDPEDALDIRHINELMEALVERSAAKNPTT